MKHYSVFLRKYTYKVYLIVLPMDVSPDVWGQLALEASQVYLTDGTAAKSPFAGTVSLSARSSFNFIRFICWT